MAFGYIGISGVSILWAAASGFLSMVPLLLAFSQLSFLSIASRLTLRWGDKDWIVGCQSLTRWEHEICSDCYLLQVTEESCLSLADTTQPKWLEKQTKLPSGGWEWLCFSNRATTLSIMKPDAMTPNWRRWVWKTWKYMLLSFTIAL